MTGLKTLAIKRFRSIPGARVHFENPAFIVGKNGSGKSNFVDAIAFIADAMIQPLQTVFDNRGGISAVRNRSSGSSHPPNIGLCVTMGPLNGAIQTAQYAFEIKALEDYGFEVLRERCIVVHGNGIRESFERKKNKFESSRGGLKPAVESNALILPIIGGEKGFSPVLHFLAAMRVFSIVPSQIREMQDPDSGQVLHRDGRNAASVLREIKRTDEPSWRKICNLLEAIVPNTKTVTHKKHGNKLSLQFTQEWGSSKRNTFEAFNMSDGTLRALGLLTAVFQKPSPTVLVIEEPEATMHTGALASILDLIRIGEKRSQVIITTHSADLLDRAEGISDKNILVAEWYEGATRIGNISEGAKEALRKHLMSVGELVRSDALTDPPDLFAEKVNRIPTNGLFDEFTT